MPDTRLLRVSVVQNVMKLRRTVVPAVADMFGLKGRSICRSDLHRKG